MGSIPPKLPQAARVGFLRPCLTAARMHEGSSPAAVEGRDRGPSKRETRDRCDVMRGSLCGRTQKWVDDQGATQ